MLGWREEDNQTSISEAYRSVLFLLISKNATHVKLQHEHGHGKQLNQSSLAKHDPEHMWDMEGADGKIAI
jgi:hypothetical protein